MATVHIATDPARASARDDQERTMFEQSEAYSGFAVPDLAAARRFYGETLGLGVSERDGMLILHLAGGRDVLVYPKPDHEPATYTILNFPVPDIDAAVGELGRRGVPLARYPGFAHDENGVVRDQDMAIGWFTDPAGNILSVLEQR